jgi:endogenous inhibitor of DNA gyrase (YacG/DUF329 family)
MTALTLWQTDDPCPDCGTTMTLAEDGSVLQAECRACGRADTWTSDQSPGGDR